MSRLRRAVRRGFRGGTLALGLSVTAAIAVAGGASCANASTAVAFDDTPRAVDAENHLAAAVAAFEAGAWSDALREIDAAHGILRVVHDDAPHVDLVGCHGMAARVHLAAGDRAAAHERFQRGTAVLLELAAMPPAHGTVTQTTDGVLAALTLMIELAADAGFEDDAADLCVALEAHRAAAGHPVDHRLAATLERGVRILRQLERHADTIPLLKSLAEHHRDSRRIGHDLRHERTLRAVADAHRAIGDVDGQIEWLESIVAARTRADASQFAAVAAAHVDVGDALLAAGRPHNALRWYERALTLRRTPVRPGEDVPDAWAIAEMLDHVAVTTEAVGRLDDALPIFEEALAMRRRLAGDKPNRLVAASLTNLASSLNRLGRPGEAIVLGKESLAMLHAVIVEAGGDPDDDDIDVATILNNLAAAHHTLGRQDLALPLQERSTRMRLRLDGETPSPDGILASVNFALALHLAGRTGEASAEIDRTLARLDSLPAALGAKARSAALQVAATIRAAFGRGDDAVAAMREAVSLARSRVGDGDHPEVAGLLVDLMTLLGNIGRHDEAIEHGALALGMFSRVGRDNHPDRATTLMKLATQEAALGDLDSARHRLDMALVTLEAAFGDADHPLVVECLDLLAYVVNEDGDRDRALALSRRAAESAVRAKMPSAVRIAANYGWLLVDAERSEDAANWFGTSLDLQTSYLDGVGGTELERSAATGSINAFGAGVGLAWIDALRGEPEAAIAHLERSRAQTLREMLARSRRGVPQAKVARAADGHSRSHGLDPASLEQMRSALGQNDIILIYLVSPHAGAVFAVGHPDGPLGRGGEAPIRQHGLRWPEGTLVTASSLRSAIGRHLSGVLIEGRLTRGGIGRERPVGVRSGPGASHRLFEALMPQALWSEIRGARIVHVVPDASMHRLPFESLPISPPGSSSVEAREYWIDSGPMLTYSPSATVLVDRVDAGTKQLDVAAGASIELLAVGDPIFGRADGRGAPELRALPGTRVEIGSIMSTFDDDAQAQVQIADASPLVTDRAIALLGESATRRELESMIISRQLRPRILHVATHGIVESGASALESRLALTAPVDDDGGPAALTLRDLIDGWAGALSSTELVVLSACDSVGGDGAGQNLRDGEGVFGLPWGFMYAGASTVIASLWEVDDASTAELMSNFYGELRRATLPEDDAVAPADDDDAVRTLRAFTRARQALRATHPEPFHWAPFVLMGSPR